ncbi:hypothetical protein KC19_1G299800 [Ceratodon purpureus]|uniref:Galactose oxidase n=2 Tax=Ceratodon purpureus TaxID=3225 RepID=A0A8T0JAU0_CERPU|nr:hypothetical protein KC19_1G299800 [Ceratodon purpureus]
MGRMMSSLQAGLFLQVVVVLQLLSSQAAAQGSWKLLNKNAGIAAMHAAVTHFDTVIMLDRTNIGPSAIKLPGGRCRKQPLERISKTDCFAHSVMFNPRNGGVRPLFVFTDTWCSSGQFFANGMMVQTGGDFEGNRKIRTLAPCAAGGNCDWTELKEPLAVGRWYSSNQLLPSGIRQIIVGGRAAASYEFYPKRKPGEGAFKLGMLAGTDNLYPFVYLLPNGDLFIFANRNSVQLNWGSGKVVRNYPIIPGNPRNYPSAGSAVLLPLTSQTGFGVAEVMICGGAAAGASRTGNVNAPASASCGRMVVTAGNPKWAMSNMPIRRTMGDMINLPSGDVLIINGAQNGFQGWGKANNPALNPVNYNPTTGRYQVFAKTNIPRLYHSTANLLSDGRILLAGSNTHQFYTYTGKFPTELRVEAFSPPYLQNGNRPAMTGWPRTLKYKQVFVVTFNVPARNGGVEVIMNSAPYVTHTYAQGQRQVKLKTTAPVKAGRGWSVQATAVPGATIAPPSYYIMFLVQNGIPSNGVWVKQNN